MGVWACGGVNTPKLPHSLTPTLLKGFIMTDFIFSTVGKLVFGAGRVRDIGAETAKLGSHVLLVTGKGFLERSGHLAEITGYLSEAGLKIVTFADVPPEPTIDVAEAGIAKAREYGCDVVAAVGGGSAIDVGKTIAALAVAPASVGEYFHGRAIEGNGLPFIAVPTTAGSGAEVTQNAVLTDARGGVKASIRSSYMLADVTIVDPELMLTLPPVTTAYSGMDALCQAIEAFVSKGANPLTDALAEDASARLIEYLPQAYAHGDDLDVRTEVALGSLMSGIALANARLGLVHGMAHPLGVLTGLPHGLICALLLPDVIRYNLPVSAGKYARLARRIGLADAGSLLTAVERLNKDMHIEERRPELRTSQDKWPQIISQTLASGSSKSNPRSVTAEDVEKILECDG